MSSSHDPAVEKIVARFLKSRREGERVSIDDVLKTERVDNPGALRASAIRAIARRSRSGGASACPPTPEDGADHDSPSIDDLPEMPTLEGYDVIDCAGRGGMGAVYEAYQQSTGRRVAIKVMLEGVAATESARRRFEREVELVARLQHPHIVSVIDSGAHRARYYCVMEYVDGRPLDHVLTPGHCPVRDAMRLVATICEAVDYAHQRGVLHRDLKPSNILVDDAGVPHLLDFGLAKAIRPSDDAAAYEMSLSQPGQLLGTLAYMPPEQARGRLAELSVRSDVYSLGAIAYELVTGALPCDVDGALGEALLRIEHRDPERPSALRPRIGADVDAILLKALEKSPERRWLADEPILARRVGPATRAARWVKRNRRIAGVGAAAIVAVVAVTAVAFFRVMRERDATREVAASFYGSIQGIQPDKVASRVETIDEIMDGAAASVERLRSQPDFQARLRNTIGLVYRGLGKHEKAEEQFRAALESRRDIHGDSHPDVAEAHHNLASALYWLGDYRAAEPHYRRALAIRQKHFRRGDTVAGRELARTLDHLASTLSEQGLAAEAVEISRQALAFREDLLGPDHVDVAQSLNNLARILNVHGRFDEAGPLCERARALLDAAPGDDQRRGVASVLHNLAWSRFGQGRLSEAEALSAEANDLMRDLWGEDHDRVAGGLLLLAEIKRAAGDGAEAERLAAKALDIWRDAYSDPHPDPASALLFLGTIRLERADPAGAEPLLRECYDLRRRIWPSAPHWRTAEAQSALGECLAALGRDEEAESQMLESAAALRARRGDADPATRAAVTRLADFYDRRGHTAKAAAQRDLLAPAAP